MIYFQLAYRKNADILYQSKFRFIFCLMEVIIIYSLFTILTRQSSVSNIEGKLVRMKKVHCKIKSFLLVNNSFGTLESLAILFVCIFTSCFRSPRFPAIFIYFFFCPLGGQGWPFCLFYVTCPKLATWLIVYRVPFWTKNI